MYNVLSISMIEVKGFEVIFGDGKAILRPIGSNSTGDIIGVRENGIYRFMMQPIDQGKNQVLNN